MSTTYQIRRYEEIDSTNLEARRLISQGFGHGTVILAETQLAGRGRLGRTWVSAKGTGLWFSVILTPKGGMQQASQYSFVMAVAVAEGIRAVTGLEAKVKWPNDIVLHGKKVCGILLELAAEPNQAVQLIAGIGINANQQPDDFPEEVQAKATSLAIETGRELDRQALLDAVLRQITDNLALLERQGFDAIRERWLALSCVMGKKVQILQHGDAILHGTAVGLAEDGALLVETKSGIVPILAGDVSLRAEDGSYV